MAAKKKPPWSMEIIFLQAMNIISVVGHEPPFPPPSRLRFLPRPGDPRPLLQHAQRERAAGKLLAHALAQGALSQVP